MLINTFHNANYTTQNTPRRVVATPSFGNSVDKPSTHGAFYSMAYVYRHIRLDKNQPFYIGIGADKDYKRAYDKNKGRRSELWYRIISKTEYEVEILIDDISVEEAKRKEVEFIKLYGRRDLGTGYLINMTDGGDGLNNKVYTPEYRKKLSEAAKKRPPQPQLQKIIEWRRNNLQIKPETREKLSKIHKGKKLSVEHIENCRIAKRGEKNPMYGKRLTDCPNFKGFIEVYRDGVLLGTYSGIHDCAKHLGLMATKISACLNGKRLTHGGYTYKRIFKDQVF